ncbi:MAG: hypothetical protein AAF668_14555 [Pseudomonadota bacterium]
MGVFEAFVIGFISFVFCIYAARTILPEDRDAPLNEVLVGAGLYGAVVGAIIAFFILPLRVVIVEADAPAWMAAAGGFAVFLTMFTLRRGVIGHLPIVNKVSAAFRRANLRKTIRSSRSELIRLEDDR